MFSLNFFPLLISEGFADINSVIFILYILKGSRDL